MSAIESFRERALLAEQDGRHDAAALLREAANDLEMKRSTRTREA